MVNREQLIVLGKHIKALREAKKLTQKELAHSLGKDQQSIQRLESGNVNPSYVYLLSIAKGLDISLAELIDIK